MQISLNDILSVFSFGMGACIASFLNVVIYRVPRGESIVRPASHCPKCNAAIKWYQNIPILSYLALRGRCAKCRERISPRYLFIELTGALLFLAAFKGYGIVYGGAPFGCTLIRLLTVWLWISLMIVGSMIDYDLKLLPDFVTVGGMILGVVSNGLVAGLNFSCLSAPYQTWPVMVAMTPLVQSLIGLIVGFGLFWLIRFLGSKVFKREAMGLGDVFLMGAVGAISGPVAVFFVLIFSSLFGSIIGLSMVALSKIRLGKFAEIPYGPYICLAHLFFLFYGPTVIHWYVNLLK